MKKITLLLFLIFVSELSHAQGSLASGRNQLNVGVGLSSWGIPIYIGFDHGVSQDITLGLELSYRAYKEKHKNIYYNSGIIGFLGNGNYHFNRILHIPNKFDFYAGLNIGFYSWSSPSNYYRGNNSGIGLGLQVGGRYFISSKAALNLEFGGGNAFSGGKFGLTFKL
jgi:outer membrane immunogenic protein